MIVNFGKEWRVLVYVHAVKAYTLTTKTYGSEASAQRACECIAASDHETGNTYTPVEVELTGVMNLESLS